jgi:hypothetical protein
VIEYLLAIACFALLPFLSYEFAQLSKTLPGAGLKLPPARRVGGFRTHVRGWRPVIGRDRDFNSIGEQP